MSVAIDGWLVLRAVLLVAAFVGFAWALLVSRRDNAAEFARLAARHDLALVEIQRLSHRLIEIGGAIGSLEEKLQQSQAPQPVAAPSRPAAPAAAVPPGARGYEMAIRLARGGASVEEIVASCGTTRSEARLLRRLHCAGGASAA